MTTSKQTTSRPATQGETKHTPGKWEWDGFGKITALYGAKIIALVGKELDGFRVGLSRSEKDAAARLIAAAPELLAALEAMVSEVDSGCQMSSSPVIAARAAIAKAKGAK